MSMQFSSIKLPPVHDPQSIKRLHTYSHMKIKGGCEQTSKMLDNIFFFFAMPLKIRCIQVTPPTKDKSHIQFAYYDCI